MGACKRHATKSVFIAILLVATSAAADDALLYGTIMAAAARPDAPGDWRYEMRVTWENNSPFALSHFNLKLDDGTNCNDEDIRSYLIWNSPAGVARCFGVNAAIYFDAVLEMGGDPSLGIDVPLIKYEPNDMSEIRPGPNGVGVFVFWSNLPPWPIDRPNVLLSEKFGQLHSFGQMDGVFPALPCDPIATDQSSWGAVKAGYGH
ncbi:hypothetical protein KKG45_03090 [bacterium]|nr:hypothetical protein [bacterium]MBU1072210.1 hypothetical protein [bacterium]MBU1675134.1 hypothetical protein [bacterium]